MKLDTPERALALLERMGATLWLLQHHPPVLEASVMLCESVVAPYDKRLVLVGAAFSGLADVS